MLRLRIEILSRFDEIHEAMRRGDRKKQEDYYLQQIAQVKMKKWKEDRVVLLGGAAYCPSPISGVVSMLLAVYDYALIL